MSRAAQRPASPSRTTILYATLAVLAILAVVGVALSNRLVPKAATTVNPTSALKVGDTAPTFSVTTNAGPFDLATVSTPVFLEVFATWCPHCQHEIPVVGALAHQYAGKVAFVGVTGSPYGVDGSSPENQADVNGWVQTFNVAYPVAYDAGLSVANNYLQTGYPTIVMIDAQKKIRYIGSGEVTIATLKKAIDGVLSSGS